MESIKDSSAGSSSTTVDEDIEQLLNTSFDLARTDPQRSMELAREALARATALGHNLMTARAMRLVAGQYFYLSDYTSAMEYLQKAHELVAQLGTQRLLALIQDQMAQIYSRQGDFATALSLQKKNLLIDEYISDPIQHHRALNQMGIINAKQGEYAMALEAFFQALAILQDRPQDVYYATCYNNIAAAYQSTHSFPSAAQYYQRALSVYKACSDRQGEAVALLNLGGVLAEMDEFDSALDCLWQAQVLFHALGTKAREAWVYAFVGGIYVKTADYTAALSCLDKAFELVQESGNMEFTAFIYINKAKAYSAQQHYTDALSSLHKALDVAIATGDPVREYECHQELSAVYEQIHDPGQALLHYKLYTIAYQKIQASEKQQTIAGLKARFELERLEHEREVQQLRADRLQNDIDHKNKELTLLALQIVQSSECMNRVRQHIQSMKNSRTKLHKEILRLVQTSLRPRDNWKTFALQFQMIHQGFQPKLLTICPTLTPTELKICSLLKIGLTSKDIANVLFSSVRTVETHRNTIRKKLQIPPHDSLTSFITRL